MLLIEDAVKITVVGGTLNGGLLSPLGARPSFEEERGEWLLHFLLETLVSNVLPNVTGCMFAIVRFNSFAQFYSIK